MGKNKVELREWMCHVKIALYYFFKQTEHKSNPLTIY